MIDHGKGFTPRLCEVLGDDQLRLAVRAVIEKAEKYGFTNRGPIRLCVELMFLCGSAFDTDPQYPGLGEVLRSKGDQMERAQLIHRGSTEYLDKVSGPGATNLHRSLKDLLAYVRNPPAALNGFVDSMVREMKRIYPEKADYLGESKIKALINEAVAEASMHGFTGDRETALMVVVMYSFGHGCTADPLYPWISRTLNDERTVDAHGRAERLEKKAIIWLENVVARNDTRART